MTTTKKLTVTLSSFSYKKGMPIDATGNGGGFIFDCRCLPNPGRLEQFKDKTGIHPKVQDFLNKESEVKKFIATTFKLATQAVKNYRKRQFTNLMISYGCTGGQHRSVYCVEKLARRLRKQSGIRVKVQHMNLKRRSGSV